MLPKILVGCPTASLKEYCLEKYLQRLKELTYPNFDVLLVDNSQTDDYCKKIRSLKINCIKTEYSQSVPERVIKSRNILREYALSHDYDYFLSLEQDVLPPKNVIELLLEAHQDIVAGITPHLLVKNGKEQEIALIGIEDKQGGYTFVDYKSSLNYRGIVPVDYVAMGCLLLSKKVLQKISFRFQRHPSSLKDLDVEWDDLCFCKDAKKEGFSIYANIGVKCEHFFYGGYSATLGDTTDISKTPKTS